MSSSPRDDNRVPAVMVTSSADGVTPMRVYVNPSNHGLKIEDGSTGSSFPFVNAERDDNRVSVLWGVSSADGRTPIPIYGNPSTGAILVKSL